MVMTGHLPPPNAVICLHFTETCFKVSVVAAKRDRTVASTQYVHKYDTQRLVQICI
jgi:hypothetical protein